MTERPLINVLVRTSGRPNYYARCIQSILDQTYDNFRIIVSADDPETERYVRDTKFLRGGHAYSPECFPVRRKEMDDDDEVTLRQYPQLYYAPHNLYLNRMKDTVNDGWLMFLDDDDMMARKDAMQKIADRAYSENAVIFWRVGFSTGVIPSDAQWKHAPGTVAMSGIGFAYHSAHRCLTWDQFSTSDRRIMHAAWSILETHVWINEVLTAVQRSDDFGRGRRDDAPVASTG